MTEYQKYQNLLGPIPEFLKKYLSLDILLRLKDISLECGMDYASKHAYDIRFFISRYEHSLSVALITWHLTKDKKATLASLFHDIASPVFSHVIDYMNGDFINQESTEEKTYEILYNSKELRELLKIDNIDIKDIIDFKKYSIVDLPRPKMCADRLDNIIAVGMHIVHKIDFNDACLIISSLTKVINEDGEEEISFTSEKAVQKLIESNNAFNQLTHSKKDNY
ncbi:MAG: HD domain-containing protein, partial [Bacilli bacterium]|nr:HD domain-containing protein [Bacilli bacterium]